MALMISATCHFVWLGKAFPWLNALAVVSAAERGGFERVVLHTDNDLTGTPHFAALRGLPGFEQRLIDVGELARNAVKPEDEVRRLLDDMRSPASRSNVLRALILAGEGGVYLDTDTVTVASFDALREHAAFVGEEVICFPEWSQRGHSLGEAARAYSLSALRMGLRWLPRGYRVFSRIEGAYSLQPNNAVLGAERGGAFVRAYLDAMFALPVEIRRRRFALGPDLLARVCREHEGTFVRLPPRYFYPLPPVISEQWWSLSAEPSLGDVVTRDTVVVHWYSSVRNQKYSVKVDPAYVRSHEKKQLFSRLSSPYLSAF